MRIAFSVKCTSVVSVDEDIWNDIKDKHPDLEINDLFKLYVEHVDNDKDMGYEFWAEVGEELEVFDVDYSDVSEV